MVNIEIDILTNSILHAVSDEVFETQVEDASSHDLKNLQDWNFNWTSEKHNFTISKLSTILEPETIQGLISWKIERGFIYVSLIENAPFNVGKKQIYKGVAGNLFAFACKQSFENGFDGFIAFDAKTNLIEHYKKSLNAQLVGGQRMVIENRDALSLVKKYFKNFKS
jgi:hypothetical protein